MSGQGEGSQLINVLMIINIIGILMTIASPDVKRYLVHEHSLSSQEIGNEIKSLNNITREIENLPYGLIQLDYSTKIKIGDSSKIRLSIDTYLTDFKKKIHTHKRYHLGQEKIKIGPVISAYLNGNDKIFNINKLDTFPIKAIKKFQFAYWSWKVEA